MMLGFALEYREAINSLTADRGADLRALEINDEEWELVRQLRDVLKVSPHVTVTCHVGPFIAGHGRRSVRFVSRSSCARRIQWKNLEESRKYSNISPKKINKTFYCNF